MCQIRYIKSWFSQKTTNGNKEHTSGTETHIGYVKHFRRRRECELTLGGIFSRNTTLVSFTGYLSTTN